MAGWDKETKEWVHYTRGETDEPTHWVEEIKDPERIGPPTERAGMSEPQYDALDMDLAHASNQIEEQRQRISALERELAEAKARAEAMSRQIDENTEQYTRWQQESNDREDRLRKALEEGLDEIVWTKRAWPEALLCNVCGCCVSDQEPHKPNCNVRAMQAALASAEKGVAV